MILRTKLYTRGLLKGDTEERKGKAASQQADIEYLSFSQIFSVPNPRDVVVDRPWTKRRYNKIGTSEWANTLHAECERVRPPFSDATILLPPVISVTTLSFLGRINVTPRHPLASFDRFPECSISLEERFARSSVAFERKDTTIFVCWEFRTCQVKTSSASSFPFLFTTRPPITSLYFYSYNSLVSLIVLITPCRKIWKQIVPGVHLTVTNKYLQCSCATTIVR